MGICFAETNSVYKSGTQCCTAGSNDSLSLSLRCFEWAIVGKRNDAPSECIL